MGKHAGYRRAIHKKGAMSCQRRKEGFGTGLEDHQPRARETTTEKGIDASTVEQLLKEMENLKIAMVKKSDDRPTSSKYTDRRYIWCDSAEHDRMDCDEHKETLRRDLIYYEGNRIHSMDSRKPLRLNFRKGAQGEGGDGDSRAIKCSVLK